MNKTHSWGLIGLVALFLSACGGGGGGGSSPPPQTGSQQPSPTPTPTPTPTLTPTPTPTPDPTPTPTPGPTPTPTPGPTPTPTPTPPPTFGLDQRPSNAACIAPERPKSDIAVVQVFPKVSFAMPTAMVQPPLDSAHWYVTEQSGMVKRFDNKPDAAAPITVLDISQYVDSPLTGFDELGLLGIAFHPNFATNHYM